MALVRQGDKKIPVKVLQDKASFKIVNINDSGKLLLPEEQ